MKNKMLLAALIVGLLVSAACSSSAPANANKTANTTTTTTNTTTTNTNSNTSSANSNAANSNASSAANSNSTAQSGKQDFTLVNATGVEIDKLFISPHDVNDWQEDILGQDTLPDGQSVDIKFHRSETAAMWDLRIEDKQGNAIEWENLNLLEISKVTLHYDKSTGKATADLQ